MKRVLLWTMGVLLGLVGAIYILIKVVDHKVQQVFELDKLVPDMLERKDYQGVFKITNSNEKFLNIIEYLGMKIFDVIDNLIYDTDEFVVVCHSGQCLNCNTCFHIYLLGH